MKVLIVYAHPNPESFNHAVLEQIQMGLARGQHEVQTVDLYGEAFEPVLIVNSHKRRRDLLHDTYTERYRNLIADAEHLIFVYPIWWHSMPSIMRGFIERVFVSGLAYSFKGRPMNSTLPDGLLRGKSAWFVYTLDAPRVVSWLDPGWLSIKYSIFWYCGLRKVKRFYLPRVKRTSLEVRRNWLDHIYRKAMNFR